MASELYDKVFLKQLDEYPIREIYARVISLNKDEFPLDDITGRVTGGSINLDGDSAVRRTCSINMIGDNVEIRDYYWGLKNKFKLEIGMKNFIDSKYPDIIWFPQGVYLITSFNVAQSATGYNISISGKDKMALLNGEISGKIHANSSRFDIIEEYDKTDKRIETKIPVKEIIRELIHQYGNESLQKIIINDIDDYGLELLEYRGKQNMYLYSDYATGTPKKISFEFTDKPDGTFYYDYLITDSLKAYQTPTPVIDGEKTYKVAKIQFGQTAGYRLTELTYPEELVVAAGETITSVLDKIKNKMFTDFEYFYDLDGNFVFQRKPVYINKSWNTLRTDGTQDKYGRYEMYAESMMDTSPISYEFQNNKLLLSVTNTPNYTNLKNDFSIWGTKVSVAGGNIPIHLRYAIQHKPKIYRKITSNYGVAEDKRMIRKGDIFVSSSLSSKERRQLLELYEGYDSVEVDPVVDEKTKEVTYKETKRYANYRIWKVDWREIIYQMALDYRRANQDPLFERLVRKRNPWITGTKTGYEQYYIDMEGFWRQLYSLHRTDREYPVIQGNFTKNSNGKFSDTDWNNTLKSQKICGQWAAGSVGNPETLLFYIDFLDLDEEDTDNHAGNDYMGKYSVDMIGDRGQIVKNDDIRNLWNKDTPLVIFYDKSEKTPNKVKTGYTYMSIKAIESLFSVSSQRKSAKEELDNQLQNYALCTETVSISALPIYYLQPNSRIRIKNNEQNGVNGEYIVSKITIPLTYNGTMSISAVKESQTLL